MGCNWLSGSVFLGFGFDAAKFKSLKEMESENKRCKKDDDENSDEGEESSCEDSEDESEDDSDDEDQDWYDVISKMSKAWKKFIAEKNIPEYFEKCSGIDFHHMHREVISNYESEPTDGNGCIVLGYYEPKASIVTGGEQDSFEDIKLNACFPKNCGALLKEFLQEYLAAHGSKRKSPNFGFGLYVGISI